MCFLASLTLTQLAASNTNRSKLCEVGVPSELAGRAVRALCSELREAAAEGDVVDVDRVLVTLRALPGGLNCASGMTTTRQAGCFNGRTAKRHGHRVCRLYPFGRHRRRAGSCAKQVPGTAVCAPNHAGQPNCCRCCHAAECAGTGVCQPTVSNGHQARQASMPGGQSGAALHTVCQRRRRSS